MFRLMFDSCSTSSFKGSCYIAKGINKGGNKWPPKRIRGEQREPKRIKEEQMGAETDRGEQMGAETDKKAPIVSILSLCWCPYDSFASS